MNYYKSLANIHVVKCSPVLPCTTLITFVWLPLLLV